MSIESIYLEAWLDSLLNNDSLLIAPSALNGKKFYRNRAPQGVSYPVGVFNIQSSVDFNSLNQNRLIAEYLVQARIIGEVKGIGLQSPVNVRTSANRLDVLLNGQRRIAFTVESVIYYFNTWRESELPLRELSGVDENTFYRQYGGLYRVQVFN